MPGPQFMDLTVQQPWYGLEGREHCPTAHGECLADMPLGRGDEDHDHALAELGPSIAHTHKPVLPGAGDTCEHLAIVAHLPCGANDLQQPEDAESAQKIGP